MDYLKLQPFQAEKASLHSKVCHYPHEKIRMPLYLCRHKQVHLVEGMGNLRVIKSELTDVVNSKIRTNASFLPELALLDTLIFET